MIFVSSDVPKQKACGSCLSKDRVVKVEIGSENHISSFHLCNHCSKELHAQLEVMTDGLDIS